MAILSSRQQFGAVGDPDRRGQRGRRALVIPGQQLDVLDAERPHPAPAPPAPRASGIGGRQEPAGVPSMHCSTSLDVQQRLVCRARLTKRPDQARVVGTRRPSARCRLLTARPSSLQRTPSPGSASKSPARAAPHPGLGRRRTHGVRQRVLRVALGGPRAQRMHSRQPVVEGDDIGDLRAAEGQRAGLVDQQHIGPRQQSPGTCRP